MKIKDLAMVLSSATCVTLTTGGHLDEGGKFEAGYGVFEDLVADYGGWDVESIWPVSRDHIEVVIIH